MKRRTMKVRRGRPKGAKNLTAEIVPAELARCPKCKGTEYRRVPGRSPRVFPHAGLNGQGRPYSAVVWRHCQCSACGQRFVEKTHENRPPSEDGRPPGRGGRGRQRKGRAHEE